jgi:hypothetical protein
MKEDYQEKEKRRSRRIGYNLDVEVKSGGNGYSGFIENLSREGLFVIASHFEHVSDFVTGAVISVDFQTPSGIEMELRCEIKRMSINREPLAGSVYFFGLEIIDPPLEYEEFYISLSETASLE